VIERVLAYGRMIRFSHTVFALPFALSAAVLAFREIPVRFLDIGWILVAMVGARSAAMGFNRIADAEIDAGNPRTQGREIPSGKLTRNAAKRFVLFFSLLFIFASAMLGKFCFYLSFPVLFILFFYSYTKRFTWLSHLYLGFSLSLAPLGAWIALTGSFSLEILALCLALLTYIAGFDILYACQDIRFDRQEGLFSIPARFGVKRSLAIAAFLHFTSLFFFLMIHIAFDMRWIYLSTVVIIGFLFILEHRLVKPDDLSRINIAFFHVNSIISVTVFAGILAEELVRRLS
jgi:4-hydroxybenzoate polyprenyltransferase